MSFATQSCAKLKIKSTVLHTTKSTQDFWHHSQVWESPGLPQFKLAGYKFGVSLTIITFDNYPHSTQDNTILTVSFVIPKEYVAETHIGYT